AELLGALVNGVFLLALCFSILLESIVRIIRPNADQELNKPVPVLVVGVIGLIVNLIGVFMFHGHTREESTDVQEETSVEEPISESSGNAPAESKNWLRRHPGFAMAMAEGTPDTVDEEFSEQHVRSRKEKAKKRDLNMRGVFLHLLSDLLGSVIVVVCAIIAIAVDSSWTRTYLDPALSICVVILICSTTVPLVYETALILLQTTPGDVNVEHIKDELLKIEGVERVHEFHVWRLIGERIIATMHLKYRSVQDYLSSVERIKHLFHANNVHSITLQPEFDEVFP
ncbi:cation efflux family protein, partial [Aphelenchoides avenae]